MWDFIPYPGLIAVELRGISAFERKKAVEVSWEDESLSVHTQS